MKKLFLTLTLVVVTHTNLKADIGFTLCQPNNLTYCDGSIPGALFFCQTLKNGNGEKVCIPSNYNSPFYQNPKNIPGLFNSCKTNLLDSCGGYLNNLHCEPYLSTVKNSGICVLTQD
jgi:hypothetical protein